MTTLELPPTVLPVFPAEPAALSLPAEPAAPALPEGPLSPSESSVIGYLLGRRQDAERIAQGMGQNTHEINALCQNLYLRGLLSLTELHGQTLYSVR